LIIILCYSSYPEKVKKLENKVKKLERNQKGDSEMSKIISELIGKECKIRTEEALVFAGNVEVSCSVLDVDDEWVKILYADKKGTNKIKILRIESIDNIELTAE
jgi:hypothetical protein